MANVDLIRGLRPRFDLTGYQPQLRKYFIPSTDSTAVFVGDAVKSAGGADSNGIATVAQVAAGDAIRGVVVGVDQVTGLSDANFNLYRRHRPASIGMYVKVIDDPNCVFEVQADDVSATLAAADIGLNANLVVGSGSAVTGDSGMELDTDSKNTTATLQLKILELVQAPDNEAFAVNQKVIVKINNHELGSHTGTAGVS